MRVKLKANKSIEFLDGSGTINTNDVMRQVLEVEVEDGVIATGESLWVTFAADGFNYTSEILFEKTEREYKTLIPQEVLAFAGEWSFQLFVRLYSTTNAETFVSQLASKTATFTVQNGLPVEYGAPVNNATIANLYNIVKDIPEKLDKKLDKNTDSSTVYGVDDKGSQTSLPYSDKPVNDSLLFRDYKGRSMVQTPEDEDDIDGENSGYITNKRYVNRKFARKLSIQPGNYTSTRVYGVDAIGNQTMIPVYKDPPEPDSIPSRRDSGSIVVGKEGAVLSDNEATPKSYVDSILQAAKDYTDSELAEFDFIKVVSALPESGLPNKIYLVAKTDTEDNADLFDEYIWINNKWEFVGTKQFEIDLSGYVTTDTNQEITGRKYFRDGLTTGAGNNSVLIDDTSITFFNTNGSTVINQTTTKPHPAIPYTISLPEKSGTLVVDSDLDNYVDKSTDQYILGHKTFFQLEQRQKGSDDTFSSLILDSSLGAIIYTPFPGTDHYNLYLPNKHGKLALKEDIADCATHSDLLLTQEQVDSLF